MISESLDVPKNLMRLLFLSRAGFQEEQMLTLQHFADPSEVWIIAHIHESAYDHVSGTPFGVDERRIKGVPNDKFSKFFLMLGQRPVAGFLFYEGTQNVRQS